MSDLLNFLSEHKFTPSNFDSVLNPHSNNINCNIDQHLGCNCKYYDTNTIIEEGALHQNEFSIFHHNSRSLNKKASITVDYISVLNHSFDIIGFTETWFNSVEESNLIDLENYSKIDSIRPNRTGGGASIFINSKHNFIQRNDLNINTTDCDSIFIKIPDKNISVGVVYKPDYVDYEEFISQLEVALDTITKEKKRGFIMGDFNIDLLKYDHNHQVNTFVNLIYSYSFFPCIDRPTRVCPTINGTTISLIDNIFTNDTDHKITSGNLLTDLSDHFPNFISTKGPRFDNITKPINKLTRQLKPNNIKGFKNSLSLVNWDYINRDDNPETSYSNFIKNN